MAKFCESCKRSYPDDQNTCPHCGAPARPAPSASDSSVDLGRPPAPGEAAGPGSPGSGGLSGHSVIGWADLVEEPGATGSAVKVDSPSDADLLRRAREEEQAGGAHPATTSDVHLPEKS